MIQCHPGCLLFRRIHYTPPNRSDVVYAAILPVPSTHLLSPLIWEASLGQFEVDFDIVSLHPVSIDFYITSDRSDVM